MINKSAAYLLFFLFVCVLGSSILAEENSAPVKKQRTVVIKDTRDQEMDYKLLPLGVMDYEKVNQLCRPWLSPGGLLVHEENRGSVLVYDTPAVVKKISDFLRESDRSAPNIRIDFEYAESGNDDVTYVAVKPKNKAEGKKWEDPKVKARMEKGNERRFTGQFIVTRSGMPSTFWSGETMIDPSWLAFIKRYPGRTVMMQNGKPMFDIKYTGDPQMTQVGAMLYVKPQWNDDGTIDVELYPEIRYLDGKGQKKSVKVVQLSTHVKVKEGQRILVGGMISSSSDNFTSVFGPEFLKRSDIQKISNMYLTATRVNDSKGVTSSIPKEGEKYPYALPQIKK